MFILYFLANLRAAAGVDEGQTPPLRLVTASPASRSRAIEQ
jgi:hypothetical protein